MQIILLSGGSGKRLWPLSNDSRSKQFLRLLPSPDGGYESVMQRIARQLLASEIKADITVTTSVALHDSILNQFKDADIVTEPQKRGTFAAIALASAFLLKEKECSEDEVVVVMPSDSFVEDCYYDTITQMAKAVEKNEVDIVLMGVKPTKPSSKFGYIIPSNTSSESGIKKVAQFIEKPDHCSAVSLIEQGALWSGGVFAFRLGYVAKIIDEYIGSKSFSQIREDYSSIKRNSFDYEVVEKSSSLGFIAYDGEWSDLGTWYSLCKRLDRDVVGTGLVVDECENSHVINELDIPVVCLGLKDMVVATSPDGILVSTKKATLNLRSYADTIKARPMYEERRWGTYKVMGHEHFEDGHNALTKLLYLNAGCNISYQYHNQREEIWTFVDGKGLLVLDGEVIEVSRGYVAHIKAGQKHAVKAITDLQIIEVQTGGDLVEEDIIRLDWQW